MVGGKQDVFLHEPLGVHLQPLRFLESILEDLHQAVVISTLGAVLVNIPDAGRYALHKMLVYAERRVRSPQKAVKDLKQAAALIEALSPHRSDDLMRLWKDLLARGPGWRQRARKALSALGQIATDLVLLEPMAKAVPNANRRAK